MYRASLRAIGWSTHLNSALAAFSLSGDKRRGRSAIGEPDVTMMLDLLSPERDLLTHAC